MKVNLFDDVVVRCRLKVLRRENFSLTLTVASKHHHRLKVALRVSLIDVEFNLLLIESRLMEIDEFLWISRSKCDDWQEI